MDEDPDGAGEDASHGDNNHTRPEISAAGGDAGSQSAAETLQSSCRPQEAVGLPCNGPHQDSDSTSPDTNGMLPAAQDGVDRNGFDLETEQEKTPEANKSELPATERSSCHGCELCEYSADRLSQLKAHLAKEHKRQPYSCYLCSRSPSYGRPSELRHHLIKQHNVDEPCIDDLVDRASPPAAGLLACSLCSFRTPDEARLTRHYGREHRAAVFRCRLCQQQSASQQCTNTACEGNAGEVYACEVCDQRLPSRRSLLSHLGSLHQLLVYKCTKCPMKTNRLKSLMAHCRMKHGVLTVGGEEVPRCGLCSFISTGPNLLEGHMRHEHSGAVFQCSECPLAFASKAGLKGHASEAHKDAAGSCSLVSLLRCSLCQYNTPELAGFRSHLGDGHRLPAYRCRHCKFKSFSLHYLWTHVGQKHKKRASMLGRQVELETDNEEAFLKDLLSRYKNYDCKFCDYTTCIKPTFVRHLYTAHNEAYYQCRHCPFSTTTIGDFNFHVTTKHRVKKANRDDCSKRSTRAESGDQSIKDVGASCESLLTLDNSSAEETESGGCLEQDGKQSVTEKLSSSHIQDLGEFDKLEENPRSNVDSTDDLCEDDSSKTTSDFVDRDHPEISARNYTQSPEAKTPKNEDKKSTDKKIEQGVSEDSKEFQCSLCPFNTFSRKFFGIHLGTKHKLPVFRCRLCPFRARSKTEVKVHAFLHIEVVTLPLKQTCIDLGPDDDEYITTLHTEPQLQCKDCDFSTYFQGILKKHTSLKCDFCSYRTCSKAQMTEHKGKHPSAEPAEDSEHQEQMMDGHEEEHPVGEPVKDPVSEHQDQMMDGHEEEHPVGEAVKDPVSGQQDQDQSDQAKDKDIKEKNVADETENEGRNSTDDGAGLKQFSCAICAYSAQDIASFRVHLGADHKLPVNLCRHCNFKSTLRAAVIHHTKAVHPDYALRGEEELEPREDSEAFLLNAHKEFERHDCDHCSYFTYYLTSLKTHLVKNHGVAAYQCKFCSCKFTYGKQLRIHVLQSHKAASIQDKKIGSRVCELTNSAADLPEASADATQCSDCSVQLTDRAELMRHLVAEHERPVYKCGFCEYMTAENEHVLKHMTVEHMTCKICGHVAVPPAVDLQRHLGKTHHLPMYECETCNFTTHCNSYLTAHVKTEHNNRNEELFQHCSVTIHKRGRETLVCNYCPFTTKLSASMSRHIKQEHKEVLTPAKSLAKCTLCDFSSGRSSLLKQHMVQVHKTLCFSCDKCSYTCTFKDDLKNHKLSHKTTNGLSYRMLTKIEQITRDESTDAQSPESKLQKRIDHLVGEALAQLNGQPGKNYVYPQSNISILPRNKNRVKKGKMGRPPIYTLDENKSSFSRRGSPPSLAVAQRAKESFQGQSRSKDSQQECSSQQDTVDNCGLENPSKKRRVDLPQKKDAQVKQTKNTQILLIKSLGSLRENREADRTQTLSCHICSFSTQELSALKAHHSQQHSLSPWECAYCKLLFMQKNLLLRHIDRLHRCGTCEYRSFDRVCLLHHMLQLNHRSRDTNFCCDVCSFKTPEQISMVHHCYNEHPRRKFSCKLCAYATFRLVELYEHAEREHRDANVEFFATHNNAAREGRRQKASDSRPEGKSDGGAIRDGAAAAPPSRPATELSCLFGCGYKTVDKRCLAIHASFKHPQDDGTFQCYFCGQAESDGARLDKHFTSVHTGTQHCHHCKFSTDQLIGLVMHVDLFHSGSAAAVVPPAQTAGGTAAAVQGGADVLEQTEDVGVDPLAVPGGTNEISATVYGGILDCVPVQQQQQQHAGALMLRNVKREKDLEEGMAGPVDVPMAGQDGGDFSEELLDIKEEIIGT